jgi:pyruvate formate lyase activating enzyme
MGAKGYIMQVQPFSVNDGDGIRSTIFMAGCPLRCRWCSNPEGFTATPKTGWYERKCIGCCACAEACPQGIVINLNAERERCIACGKCAGVCPADSRACMVTLTDADDVLKEIQKHSLFYLYSGGGITFSGGEATSQTEFLDCMSREIYDMGYSMDIETCGMFDWNRVSHILARMDLIFMDLKIFDSEKHKEYTGVSNERILDNIANLAVFGQQDTDIFEIADAEGRTGNDGHGPEIVIRIPVIGGVNDDDENIRASAEYVHRHLPLARMELLPYHRYGQIKYEALGMPYDHPEFRTPDKAEMERLRDIVRSEGVEIADFR